MTRHNSYLGAHVSWKIAKAFDTEARRRGIHRSRLVAKVLSAVAIDRIFDGVIGSLDEERDDVKR